MQIPILRSYFKDMCATQSNVTILEFGITIFIDLILIKFKGVCQAAVNEQKKL